MTDETSKKPWYALLTSQGALWAYFGAALFFVVFVVVPNRLYESGAGSFTGAALADNVLYVGERYEVPAGEGDSCTRGRVSVVDLDKGTRTGRVGFDASPTCTPAIANRVWCYADRTIALFDANTRQVRATSETWFHSGSTYGEDYDRPTPELLPNGELLTRAIDGRYLVIDPASEAIRELAHQPGNGTSLRWPSTDGLVAGPAFAGSLIDASTIVTGGKAQLVRYKTSMDPRAAIAVRLLSPDGTPTLTLEGGQFGGPRGLIEIGDDRVLFVDTEDGLVAVRFHAETGTVKWRLTL